MNKTLIGAWQLKSWHIQYSDNRENSYPYGKSPNGLIIYSDNGWMSAAINAQARPELDPSKGLRQQTSDTLAQAYRSYFHYAGNYRIQDGYVYHTVTQSLNPNFVGSIQKRKVEFTPDNDLILSGVDHIGEIERTHILHWQATK